MQCLAAAAQRREGPERREPIGASPTGSASEATDLANLIELQRRAIETQDLAERIARLEAQEGKRVG